MYLEVRVVRVRDVIVVGARVAGAATAMLLARRGLDVLAVDRAGFPSDTVSSHQVQLPGVALLHRWGLLDAVRDAGTPPTRHVRFDSGGTVLTGAFPEHDGVDALYSPRRTVLDRILVDAARSAGAEVRERTRVDELHWEDGRVVGVRLRGRDGRQVDERARFVVGADGKHSSVAEAVRAPVYRERPPRAFACYGYWSGLATAHGELYQRPGRAVAVFPTNDDLTMVYMSAPLGEFDAFRTDIEGNYRSTMSRCGDLGERLAAASRVERLRTTPDQPNRFRKPYGPGWVLVGDAGVVMDSVSAQGISNALRDAAALSEALSAELDGRAALPVYHARRDRSLTAMYDFTLGLAAHAQGWPERLFLRLVARRPAEVPRLLAAFAGITPPDEFFGPRTMAGLLLRPCRGGAGGGAVAADRDAGGHGRGESAGHRDGEEHDRAGTPERRHEREDHPGDGAEGELRPGAGRDVVPVAQADAAAQVLVERP